MCLRAPAAPFTAILFCDRILFNRHIIWFWYAMTNSFDQKAELLVTGVLVALNIKVFTRTPAVVDLAGLV